MNSDFVSRYVKLIDTRQHVVVKRTLKFNDFIPSLEPLVRESSIVIGVTAALDLESNTVSIFSLTPQFAYSKRSNV